MPPTIQPPKSSHGPTNGGLSRLIVQLRTSPRPAEQWRKLPQIHLPPLNRRIRGSAKPIRAHLPLPLHVHQTAFFSYITPQFIQGFFALKAYVDFEGLAVALHARRGVDGVSEEAVAGHCQADDSGNDGA